MKKGFTLVELLAVLILIGLFGLIVIPSITKLIKNSRQDLYNNQIRMIEESARKWGVQNLEQLSKTSSNYIRLSDLIADGYIEQDTLKNPKDNTDMNGCIVANYNKQGKKYKYVYNDNSCESFYGDIDLTSADPEYVCYNFDANSGTIVSYNKNNPDCSKDVRIPSSIDGVTIRHIAKAAFYQPKEQWCYREEKLPINILLIGMIGPESFDEYSEEELMQLNLKLMNNFNNYDIYDLFLENGYDELPVSYKHTENDGYDGCYYYETANSNKINSIIFPSTIETIGDYAFMSNSIERIDLSNISSLQSIGEFAFSKNKINTLNFGDLETLEEIKGGAFSKNSLTDVDLSGLTNLMTLGKIGAVRHLSTSYTSDSFFSIMRRKSNKIKKESDNVMDIITLGKKIETTKFSTPYIYDDYRPSNMEYMEEDFFDSELHDVNEGSGVFEGNLLTSIDLSNLDNLTVIGDYTFASNTIKTLDLRPSFNLNIIGKSAFANNRIKSINLNNLTNLEKISNGAFAYNSLSTVDLTTLTSLTHLGDSDKPYMPYTYIMEMMGEYDDYGNSYNSSNPAIYANVSEKMIAEPYGYYGRSTYNITYLHHNDYGVFEKNYLTSVNFLNNNSIEEIGNGAFLGNLLETIDFSSMDYLTNVGDFAFTMNNIMDINLSSLNSLESIGIASFTFNYIESLNLINLPNLKKIGEAAFGMNNISSLTLENLNSLTKIGISAFSRNNISSVTIPASVTYIGYEAFEQYENNWEEVNILFNETNLQTRFDENWMDIGWPCELNTNLGC